MAARIRIASEDGFVFTYEDGTTIMVYEPLPIEADDPLVKRLYGSEGLQPAIYGAVNMAVPIVRGED